MGAHHDPEEARRLEDVVRKAIESACSRRQFRPGWRLWTSDLRPRPQRHCHKCGAPMKHNRNHCTPCDHDVDTCVDCQPIRLPRTVRPISRMGKGKGKRKGKGKGKTSKDLRLQILRKQHQTCMHQHNSLPQPMRLTRPLQVLRLKECQHNRQSFRRVEVWSMRRLLRHIPHRAAPLHYAPWKMYQCVSDTPPVGY